MHFRSLKKTAGDVSLSETLDLYGDGEGLYLIDVVSQEDDMAERIGGRELCSKLRQLINETLDEREADVILLRYGLGGAKALTQRETAVKCGISRSYVSDRHYCK